MMIGVTPRQNALRCRRMVANPVPELRRAQFDRIHKDCVHHTVDMIRGPSVRRDSKQLKRLVLDQENVRRTWHELYKTSHHMYLPWQQWSWNLRIGLLQLIYIMLFESELPLP